MELPKIYRVSSDWRPKVEWQPVIAFDTETMGLKDLTLLDLSWAWNEHTGYVCSADSIPPIVLEWLIEPSILKVGHNIKHDYKAIKSGLGIDTSPFCDTRLMQHQLEPLMVVGEGLKPVARAYGFMHWTAPQERYEELGGTWPAPPEIRHPYAGCDAVASYFVYSELAKRLDDRQRQLVDFLCRAEVTLADAELAGLKVDAVALREAAEESRQVARELEVRLAKTATYHSPGGLSLNIRSGPQLARWLYDEQRVVPPKRTMGGSRSVDKDALRRILRAKATPPYVREFVEGVGAYRAAVKLAEKCENLLSELSPDGYLRTSFNLAGTATGRLSSAPNVQNFPRQGPIRKSIVSRYR